MNLINTNSSEIAKIVHDYIERGIDTEYDLFNSPPPPIYIGPVKVKTLKERLEETKMKKATSVQSIKNVKDISVTIENYPVEMGSKITIVASTDDDIFAFEFEGPDLLQSCKKAGLLNGWEKNQKIKELEKELGDWKIEAADCLKLRDEYKKKIKHLEQENKTKCENCLAGASYEEMYNNLRERMKKEYENKIKELEKELRECKKAAFACEKARDETRREKNIEINELKQQLQQAEHDKRRLTWKNEELKDKVHDLEEKDLARQKAYDILDKALQNSQKNCNKWYEKWVKMQSEQDGHTNTRADILDQAKKCVCGQREQDYGTPESNFQLIADLWNDYLKKEQSSIVVDSTDVAMMMALLKIARIRNGGGSGDSFVDLAGYAACGGEIWYGGKTQVPEGE